MPAMPTTEFCLPKPGKAVPSGPHWIHEVKYDGYRLSLERDGDRVRLFSRGGHDWGTLDSRDQPGRSGRRSSSSTARLWCSAWWHSRKHDHEVQLYTFDCLAYDGDDLSP